MTESSQKCPWCMSEDPQRRNTLRSMPDGRTTECENDFHRTLRDDTSPDGRRIWGEVDKAAMTPPRPTRTQQDSSICHKCDQHRFLWGIILALLCVAAYFWPELCACR